MLDTIQVNRSKWEELNKERQCPATPPHCSGGESAPLADDGIAPCCGATGATGATGAATAAAGDPSKPAS
ncbi:hypothetical protein NHX12_006718 [Muraenolepis orangiensis]|uniref:Uncharacterized protein n=1 Tax=Muraenolepis orangiensis TaxID=630683 RepID=A0A9Q0DMT9_9TELE|nr:hypothetical protein NHX12_006718 [Muraenolepis orangiensis]